MRQAPGTLNARVGGLGGAGIVLRNGRSHTASALNLQADNFRLQNVLAPLIHVLYLEPIHPYRLEIQTMSDQSKPFSDPTGLFDGHIYGGMHDGCPCKACAFCRDSEAGN